MASLGMDFFQNQQMTQQMHLSAQMQQSLNFLMMSHYELRENLYKAIDLNPAIELIREPRIEVKNYSTPQKKLPKELKTSSRAEIQQKKSDDFQIFLENQEDENQTIQQHLWEQFCLTTSEPEKLSLGEKLISNLDHRGFNQIHPHSLLDFHNPKEDSHLLEECLVTIQNLDPVGCCTGGSEESLYIQALSKIQDYEAAPPSTKDFFGKDSLNLALFFLAGNLSMLERPRPALILKKLKEIHSDKNLPSPISSIMTWTCPPQSHNLPTNITESMVENAIRFIQSLNPLPASQFASYQTHYIYPEVAVEQIQTEDGPQLKIHLNNNLLPTVGISPTYQSLQKQNQSLTSEEKKMVKKSVKNAQDVILSLEFRENTIYKATQAIVEFQRDFFLKGPRYLHPLRMKDVAERVGVHETTISRMANSKYLCCQWGVFEIKYFFSNQIATIKPTSQLVLATKSSIPKPSSSLHLQQGQQLSENENSSKEKNLPKEDSLSKNENLSKEGVKFILKDLLEQHQLQNPGGKPLSDQKLADLLAQQGIKIARRTVAKYRSELNIDSSFDRK